MTEYAAYGWARDRDIRSRLRYELQAQHADETDVLIVEEMGLCQGAARVDLGIINGKFIGYEIKSPRDTLNRLPHQIEVYGRSLDVVKLITCDAHLPAVLELVPSWWGVINLRINDGEAEFQEVQPSEANPALDARALVQLLWRSEALALLIERGLDQGLRRMRKQILWDRLCESLSLEELHAAVRQALKSREGWSTAELLR